MAPTGQLHQLSHAYQLFHGNAEYGPGISVFGRDGFPWTPHVRWRFQARTDPFGAAVAPQAKSTNSVKTAATISTTGAITFSGSLVSGGVATFDVPRNITINTTESGVPGTISFTGTDYYGAILSEKILGPNGSLSPGNGLKAFKTVTAGTLETAMTYSISIGHGDTLGLPFCLEGAYDVLSVYVDSTASTTSTITAADTNTATASTGDVRGTILPSTAPNGVRKFTIVFTCKDRDTKINIYGKDQA
jgi:hypothetical protein